MDRLLGTGPFVATKPPVEIVGEPCRAIVADQTGAPFCYVLARDCHGGDLMAAKARAQRIAEALDRNDDLKAALIRAREIIQSERDCVVECATMPPHDDLTTLDDETRRAVDAYDQDLAKIDEALR